MPDEMPVSFAEHGHAAARADMEFGTSLTAARHHKRQPSRTHSIRRVQGCQDHRLVCPCRPRHDSDSHQHQPSVQ